MKPTRTELLKIRRKANRFSRRRIVTGKADFRCFDARNRGHFLTELGG